MDGSGKPNGVFTVGRPHYERAVRVLRSPDGCSLAERERILRELSACNRINALAAIRAARHGWVGASFSCAEILTVLYFDVCDIPAGDPLSGDLVVLGKGHAAAMQYACLSGCGILPTESLAEYKQRHGPQAHTDRTTAGIAVNTGSLGQALSKCCGLAEAGPGHVTVIVGDGELQEGQNYEALMTLRARGLSRLTVVVDCNGLQSDSAVADIKPIPDLLPLCAAFGLPAVEVPGNDPLRVREALLRAREPGGPRVIVARTLKGAGVSFMAADGCSRRGYSWHGGIPDEAEYRRALRELSEAIGDAVLGADLARFLARPGPVSVPAVPVSAAPSTGEVFGRELSRLAERLPALRVLDADLEKSCRLTEFAARHPEAFIEMGIAEQDMASFAGGLALRGLLPVVNTYAAFFRRCFEQVYVNATEGTCILYAGHYAGLCYGTDGKTHQCTGDVAMMRSIPGMTVLYPAFAAEIPGMLEAVVDGSFPGPVYLRLHRTGVRAEPETCEPPVFRPGEGIAVRDAGAAEAVVTSGPHTTAACAAAVDACRAAGTGFDLYSLSSLTGMDPGFASLLARRYRRLHVVEETWHRGGLRDEAVAAISAAVSGGVADRMPGVRHLAVRGQTFSTREPGGLYRAFGLDAEGIEAFLRAGVDPAG